MKELNGKLALKVISNGPSSNNISVYIVYAVLLLSHVRIKESELEIFYCLPPQSIPNLLFLFIFIIDFRKFSKGVVSK